MIPSLYLSTASTASLPQCVPAGLGTWKPSGQDIPWKNKMLFSIIFKYLPQKIFGNFYHPFFSSFPDHIFTSMRSFLSLVLVTIPILLEFLGWDQSHKAGGIGLPFLQKTRLAKLYLCSFSLMYLWDIDMWGFTGV